MTARTDPSFPTFCHAPGYITQPASWPILPADVARFPTAADRLDKHGNLTWNSWRECRFRGVFLRERTKWIGSVGVDSWLGGVVGRPAPTIGTDKSDWVCGREFSLPQGRPQATQRRIASVCANISEKMAIQPGFDL